MVRKSGHLVALHPGPVVALGQCDAQYAGSDDCILAVGLVEVATAEQQHSIRVLRLEVEELLHHRSQLLAVFLCHISLLSRIYSFDCKGTKKRGHSKKSVSFFYVSQLTAYFTMTFLPPMMYRPF